MVGVAARGPGTSHELLGLRLSRGKRMKTKKKTKQAGQGWFWEEWLFP